MVYLHLGCVGWRVFGPFQHLTLLATAITDEEDRVVAFRDGEGAWRAPGIFINYAWRTPMVTATEARPPPNRGKTERVCSMGDDGGGEEKCELVLRRPKKRLKAPSPTRSRP